MTACIFETLLHDVLGSIYAYRLTLRLIEFNGESDNIYIYAGASASEDLGF